MGELYPDNIERSLEAEWQDGLNRQGKRDQKSQARNDFQRGQAFLLHDVRPSTAYDEDGPRETILSGSR